MCLFKGRAFQMFLIWSSLSSVKALISVKVTFNDMTKYMQITRGYARLNVFVLSAKLNTKLNNPLPHLTFSKNIKMAVKIRQKVDAEKEK